MPATLLNRAPVLYSLSYPVEYSFSYPAKRFYSFEDMWAIANVVVQWGYDIPETTIQYWLKRSQLTKRGKGPMTSTYNSVDIEWFALYCLCKRVFSSHESNRIYDALLEEAT